ncbi:YsnF/AvaK domain-containing protein [Bacillus sp. B-jedd]|uniref:YsnF/AvaK domain-containing protein n=1 Tax=Bacillus sp. B-jedd TaxID=1476857 RepID=UPI0005155DD3|nr:YsnF/AvaK domain-containing protein [Bacillus sp. B-jedd]CEG28161.1 putative stress response protein [Bacillus sp. B-jedd]
MGKRVVGVYNTEEELIEAIERYQNEGNTLSNLSVYGNTGGTMSRLGNLTGVTEETLPEERTTKNRGFFESIASAFEGSDNTGESSYYDNLVGMGLGDSEAREYAGDLESGRIILFEDTAGATGTYGYSGASISNTNNNLDTDTRAGLSGQTLDTDDERTLELREEELNVNKERVQTGEVEIHKDVVEEQKTIDVPVSRQEVYVDRRPVDGVRADAGTIGDDETIRVPIVEEKVEVTKKPVVNEELVIGKKEVQSTEQVVENVKREEAHIESDGDVDIDDDKRNDRF